MEIIGRLKREHSIWNTTASPSKQGSSSTTRDQLETSSSNVVPKRILIVREHLI